MEQIWTIAKLLNWTTEYFAKKNISSARLDAELLLADLLAVERIYLYVNFDRPMQAAELAAYKLLVKRRAENEPLAYIRGFREFYKLRFTVTPAVLIPRPETEILVAAAIDHAKTHMTKRVLDLGTGSGAIAISMAVNLPDVSVLAADLSAEALMVAQINADKNAVGERVCFVVSDWMTNVPPEPFDIIVANPPYIETAQCGKLQPELAYEPNEALYADSDGLGCYRNILQHAHEYLAPNGKLFFEVGLHQAALVCDLVKNTDRYGDVDLIKDYAGIDRVVVVSSAGAIL